MKPIRHGKILALTPACGFSRALGIAFVGLLCCPILVTAEGIKVESSEVAPIEVSTPIESPSPGIVPTNIQDETIEEPIPSEISPQSTEAQTEEVTPSDNPATAQTEEVTPSDNPATAQTDHSDPSLGQQEASSTRNSSRLTGDWGGVRTDLEKAGVTIDLEFTQFYQGLASGTGSKTFKYGGKLDGFINFDFEKLGLWEGGSLKTHLEYRFGGLPGTLGGAFFPTNSAMAFPFDAPDTLVATSLYLSQQFGEDVSLLIGKINILDLVNDPFFGGWGIHKFWNTVFAAPPSGLVPPVFYGAIANVKLDPIKVSLWVYDPNDRTQEYWPNGLFSNGVTFYLTTTYSTEIDGRPTSFALNGIYSTKTGTDFSSVGDSFRAGIEPLTTVGSHSIGFQFSHLLHQNPSNPNQGWGIYLKGSIADGNPNYVQNSIYGGLGGTGLFAGRELDSFGLGYFYYNLSDDLQESVNNPSRPTSLGDVQGVEMYYSYAITPWFYLGADLQYIHPPFGAFEDAFVAGLRANIRF